MLSETNEATLLSNDRFEAASSVPIKMNKPVVIYVVQLKLYNYHTQSYQTCIKIGETKRQVKKRFKEYARGYKCIWMRPIMLFHTTASDNFVIRQMKMYDIYDSVKVILQKKKDGGFVREFFSDERRVKRLIWEVMHNAQLKQHSVMLYCEE